MPQKCCGICSDKICDFFEFRLMCTSTDIQTRKILGLPPPSPAQAKVDIKPDIKDIKDIALAAKTIPTANPEPEKSSKRKPEIGAEMNPVVSLKKIKVEPKVPQIICSICETVFTNEQDLYAHKYIRHVPTSVAKYGCTSCGFAIDEQKEWNAHKSWHSKTRKPFKCVRCNARFAKYIDFSK